MCMDSQVLHHCKEDTRVFEAFYPRLREHVGSSFLFFIVVLVLVANTF
jgi:hypothetical protein